jgi:hypothetical protein
VVWSSQNSSNNTRIHCSLLGTDAESQLEITGLINCATGNYSIRMTNTSDRAVAGSVDMYASKTFPTPNPVFDPADIEKFDEISYVMVPPNETVTITRPIPAQFKGLHLFSQVTLSGQITQLQQLAAPACGTLPIRTASFTATRQRQQVALKWQSVAEQNVLGFNVLRLAGEKDWKVVAFVPTQAAGGTHTGTLSYQHTDLNTYTGISQYRIQEVGADGKTALSEIKMVRGEEQAAKLSLFPNPSSSGSVSILFENASLRDVQVTDMSGRMVRQLRNISSANATLDNLATGLYNVQVIDRHSGAITNEKLIVKR